MKLSLRQKIGIAGYIVRSVLTKPMLTAYKPRGESFLYDPYPVFRQMHEKGIIWSPYTLSWHVCGDYQTNLALIKDDRLGHSFRLWMFAPKSKAGSAFDALMDSSLFALPAKDHLRVRKLVSPAFSPRLVNLAKPAIEKMVQEQLDLNDKDGVIDLVKLCRDIPINAMALYFNIPDGMRDDFRSLGHAILASFSSEEELDQSDIDAAERGIKQLREVFEHKRLNPDDSFMSTLINYMEDGERISEDEALALMGSLLAAGVDTTFDYTLNAFYCMMKNPEWGEWLLQNQDKAQNYIEESTRWHMWGNRGFYRFAKEDLEIMGKKIKKGEIVQIMQAVGNYDPSVFPNPEKFDPSRNNLEKAITFGVGVHYCLGHAIAKLISDTTLLALVRRYEFIESIEGPTRVFNMTARRIGTFLVKGVNKD